MNQILRLKKLTSLCVLLAATCFVSGCGGPVSYTRHTTVRAPELHGRVLDAKSHQPIEGAKVCFCEPPEYPVFTDTNGFFFMKAATNYHTVRDGAGGSWPPPKSDAIYIAKEGYITRQFWRLYNGDPMNILFEPNP